MTMKISILRLAKDDLKEIHIHLSGFGEKPSEKFRESFKKFCTNVKDNPNMYGQYKYNPVYRKAVILYDYLIFYQADEDNNTVKIYRVLHGKRNTENFI
ncbi:type II toxin-antitoxin system RelE/ParE family toxin [Sedimentibacter sp.]|uniref:type II toxin-antitoxin system RelE/ParE family toxin n=1 Tax=Sedimentibacter sp. TaxID=1960295 RepID=UPI0028A70406|nr:type II toxin-antitoxin system RelE/ParE family toxin [Sedimentibacter sp.]